MTVCVVAVLVRADVYDVGWPKGDCGNKRPTPSLENSYECSLKNLEAVSSKSLLSSAVVTAFLTSGENLVPSKLSCEGNDSVWSRATHIHQKKCGIILGRCIADAWNLILQGTHLRVCLESQKRPWTFWMVLWRLLMLTHRGISLLYVTPVLGMGLPASFHTLAGW